MLKTRVITAISLLLPVCFVLWVGSWLLILLGLAVFTAINWEFFSFATTLSQARRVQLTACSLLIPLGFLAWDWQGWSGGVVLATMLVSAICVMLVEMEEHAPIDFELIRAVAVGLFYVGILGSFLVVVPVTLSRGSVAWLVLSIVIADTFAYFGGSLLKGPKLSPRVSPNKTISGSVCGILGVVIFSIWFGEGFGINGSPIMLGLDGFLVGVAAVIGDLVESLIKRAFNVKDTGSILPGHGGLLDRVDALIFACPVLLLIS